MADQETLDSPPVSHSDDQSQSRSSSSSDLSLSRNLSSSRLNAEAPEFVPGRAPPQSPPPQPPRMMIPRPPPQAMLHVYHHPPTPSPPPFHGQIPVPHMVPVQNHHLHHLPHHHHQNRPLNHQFVPGRNQNHYGGGGEQEIEVLVKKDHDRRKSDHQKKDHGANGGTGANDAKNGLSDEAIQKILNQVEYYFSDLNLATTDHLMRFINKDSEGYVPIHVVASFKKIKALISSNSQLATVLRSSSKLIVSEDGKKVRRRHPISESDIEGLQSRIVVAENLPEDHCYQNLMKIFSASGSVKNIRTCQPQSSVGGASSASRSAKNEGALFSNKVHAFVEYETIELAEKAVTELNEEGNWRSGLRLRLMLKQKTKDSRHVQGRGRKEHEVEAQHEEDNATTSEQQPNEKPSEQFSEELDAHTQEHTGEELGKDKPVGQRKGRTRGRGKGRGRGQQHLHNHRGNDNVGAPASNNLVTSEQATMAKQPPGPRMPDGTRGFSMGRGKPLAVNSL